jgi:hypothetical protein
LLKRPYITISARETPDPVEAARAIAKFIEENKMETLNVAGPRLSGWREGYAFALEAVSQLLGYRDLSFKI